MKQCYARPALSYCNTVYITVLDACHINFLLMARYTAIHKQLYPKSNGKRKVWLPDIIQLIIALHKGCGQLRALVGTASMHLQLLLPFTVNYAILQIYMFD